jgi:hypothetical protein
MIPNKIARVAPPNFGTAKAMIRAMTATEKDRNKPGSIKAVCRCFIAFILSYNIHYTQIDRSVGFIGIIVMIEFSNGRDCNVKITGDL